MTFRGIARHNPALRIKRTTQLTVTKTRRAVVRFDHIGRPVEEPVVIDVSRPQAGGVAGLRALLARLLGKRS